MTCFSKIPLRQASTDVSRSKTPVQPTELKGKSKRKGPHIDLVFNINDKNTKLGNRKGGSPPSGSSGSKSDEECSVVQRTDALLRGLDLILEHHNARDTIRAALNVQCHGYLDTSPDESVWLKRCKYILTYPLAKFLRNPLPPAPDVAFKPTGALRGWMKERLNAFNPPNVHLWYSWFQAKRSTIPLSDKMVEQTYKTHLETLTKEDLGDESTIEEIFDNPCFQYVLNKIKRSVNREFGVYTRSEEHFGIDIDVTYYQKLFRQFEAEMPKTSACFESTRKDGGQSESLREICGLSTSSSLKGESVRHPELYSMEYRPWVYTQGGTKVDFVQSQYSAYGEHEWKTLPYHLLKKDLTVPLNCTIQAVLEPNKIRVISKGESLPYYSCKPLQLALHGIIKKMPCFALTGRPLLEGDIGAIAKHVNDINREDPSWDFGWASVDYSAATDGLSYKYSGRIQDYILSDIPQSYFQIAQNVLGPHNLHYPIKKGIEFRGLQRNGQLMGSILSFIILCIANLGVYLSSLYRTNPFILNIPFKDILGTVLINGDDMVYAGLKQTYDENIKIGRLVGLEMSVGKAYFHREYLNINSQSILYPLHKPVERRYAKMVHYLNTGLFFGLHKVQGNKGHGELAQEHTKFKDGIVPNLNCLLQGALPGRAHSILKKSLDLHKEEIFNECQTKTFRGSPHTRNLFISEKLGGMGVIPPENWKFFLSKSDLYVANGHLRRYPHDFALERPIPGPPPEDASDWFDSPWQSRLTESVDMDQRIPFHGISFKKLKEYCRSPVFEFFVPYKGCLTSKTENRTNARARDALNDGRILEELTAQLDEQLDMDYDPYQEDPDIPIVDCFEATDVLDRSQIFYFRPYLTKRGSKALWRSRHKLV